MNNNFNSIQLFKKNRELGGASLEQQTSEELPDSEQQVPELIVRPLVFKENDNPTPTNSEEITLPPAITKIVQTVLSMFDTNSKESLPLRILKDTDIRKWPIWSILKKPH